MSAISRISRSLGLGKRCFSSSLVRRDGATVGTKAPPAIYVSDSHNPFFNLAFEEWQVLPIFRKTDPSSIVLYLYRNTPSVIIGRNQNPWKEINLHRLGELGIPFVRRKSGGGTVYHDLGNTNYCVCIPRLQFERKTNAELVVRALQGLDIPAVVNDRNDICVEQCSCFYVSGSAFKLVNARAYHHGTMLIDAKLGDLKGVLGNSRSEMVTKGVASVSSPVRNLSEWSDRIDHDAFVEAVVDEFRVVYGGNPEVQRVDEGELERNEFVKGVADELQSWEWMYGQTPEFSHAISLATPGGPLKYMIKSRHALITSAELVETPSDPDWRESAEAVRRLLEGDRYGSLENTRDIVESGEEEDGGRMKDLLDRLRDAM